MNRKISEVNAMVPPNEQSMNASGNEREETLATAPTDEMENYSLDKKADKEKFKNIIKNIKEMRKIQEKERVLKDFSKFFQKTYSL